MIEITTPGILVAAALFLLSESLVEMDVTTRQSHVMAVAPGSADLRFSYHPSGAHGRPAFRKLRPPEESG